LAFPTAGESSASIRLTRPLRRWERRFASFGSMVPKAAISGSMANVSSVLAT
jgi:hypothetical protein